MLELVVLSIERLLATAQEQGEVTKGLVDTLKLTSDSLVAINNRQKTLEEEAQERRRQEEMERTIEKEVERRLAVRVTPHDGNPDAPT